MASRSRGRVITRSRRLGTSWARLVETQLTTVAAGTKVLLAQLTLDNPGITETVIRTRGLIGIVTDAPTASEVQPGAFGMVVVNDLAIAAGAASIPGPVTDQDDEGWFVWQPTLASQESVGATAVTVPMSVFHFDSKAARRIEHGFAAAVMFENASVTLGMQVITALSTLTKVNT